MIPTNIDPKRRCSRYLAYHLKLLDKRVGTPLCIMFNSITNYIVNRSIIKTVSLNIISCEGTITVDGCCPILH